MEIKSSEMQKMDSKIIVGVFQLFGNESQDEFDLVDRIFQDVDFEDEKSLMTVTPKVLELPFNEQIHFIMGVLERGLYKLSERSVKTTNMENFLGQPVFKDQRNIIHTLVDDDNIDKSEISEFEKKYNIKIVDVSRDQLLQ